MSMLRPKLTFANVMSVLAVFIALSGVGYAAFKLPKHSVGSRQIKAGAVTKPKLAMGAVSGSKVLNNSIGTSDLADASVTNSKLADGAVSSAKVAPNSLTGANIDESTLSGIGAGVVTGRMSVSSFVVTGGPPTGNSSGINANANRGSFEDLSPSVPTAAGDFEFKLTAAPGPGASRDMQFVVGTVPTTVCTISGSNTSCSGTGPVVIPAGSNIAVQSTPNNTPATADVLFGFRLITP